MVTYKLVPAFYFDKDGNKFDTLVGGGSYFCDRGVETETADKLLKIWYGPKKTVYMKLKKFTKSITKLGGMKYLKVRIQKKYGHQTVKLKYLKKGR